MDTKPWGTGMAQDAIEWDRLESWARNNLVCSVCSRRVGKLERIKMHLEPDMETREADVRIAHYTCLGYEDDGVTPWKRRKWMSVP